MIPAFRTAAAVLLTTLVASSPSLAQSPTQAGEPCADSLGLIGYERCALWLDGNRVRRGSDAAVVARPGFFRPARLVRVVAGDSARAQAALYERNAGRSYVLGGLSAAMLIAAWIVADSYDCAPVEFGFCGNSDDNHALGAGLLAIGATVSLLASIPFTIRATRAMGRAVWWHNARFAR